MTAPGPRSGRRTKRLPPYGQKVTSRELQQTRRHFSDRCAIYDRLHYLPRGERLTKDMFHPCKGEFGRIYKLKTRHTRIFPCKWHSVWFLVSGMDKQSGQRLENEAMKHADRIRKQMETWPPGDYERKRDTDPPR